MSDETGGGVEEIPAAVIVSEIAETPVSDSEKAKQAAQEAIDLTSAERARLAIEAEQRISEHSEAVEGLDQWREHQNQRMAEIQLQLETQARQMGEMQSAMSEVATMLETVTTGILANSTPEPITEPEAVIVETPPELPEVSDPDAEDHPVLEVEEPQPQQKTRRHFRVI